MYIQTTSRPKKKTKNQIAHLHEETYGETSSNIRKLEIETKACQ